jgi:viroplasmin and RNaseH domain-containing protein
MNRIQQPRRRFLQTGVAGFCTALFATFTKISFAKSYYNSDKNNLQVTARYKIHSGKVEEFKKVAEECLTIVKEKDRDTLQYDWYFNEEQTECIPQRNIS